MKKVIKIDGNGMFVEDLLIKNGDFLPENCIVTPCPGGLYHPKWNGLEWVEGLTQEEIDAIPQPVDEDALAQTELYSAIENATSLEELKTALLGGADKSGAKVKPIKHNR